MAQEAGNKNLVSALSPIHQLKVCLPAALQITSLLFISFSASLHHWHLIWFVRIWQLSIPEEQSWAGRALTEQGPREVVLLSWHAPNVSQDFPLPTPTFSLPFLVCSNRGSSYQVNILAWMQVLHLAVMITPRLLQFHLVMHSALFHFPVFTI